MKGPADELGWAKKPRSQEALDAVFTIAGRDKRFASIRDKLIKNEIATAEGKLLYRFDGHDWRPVSRARGGELGRE